jgi:hypothetical protein
MKLDTTKLLPGDVVVVKMGNWILHALIWIQALLSMKSFKYVNYGHVAVVDHRDDEGRLWGIEARAGGIGWVNLDQYSGAYGLSNAEQPKTEELRSKITTVMQNLLGTSYDYYAYLEIALNTLGITKHWTDFQGNDVPVQFICSAVADYVYEDEKLPNPGGYAITRYTTPAEWAAFIDKKQWNNPSE